MPRSATMCSCAGRKAASSRFPSTTPMWRAGAICSRTSCCRRVMSLSSRKVSPVSAFVRLALPAPGGLALLLGASAARAQAWIWDPRIEVQCVYNDNNRLTPDKTQENEEKETTQETQDAQQQKTQTNI